MKYCHERGDENTRRDAACIFCSSDVKRDVEDEAFCETGYDSRDSDRRDDELTDKVPIGGLKRFIYAGSVGHADENQYE